MAEPAKRFFIQTLGCPKNQVDSDKIVGTLLDDGMEPVGSADAADLIVVNTCAFIDEAREESINTILAIEDERSPDAQLVVTGCMAERYGDELADALPEVDQVAGFGVPVNLTLKPVSLQVEAAPLLPKLDLLNLRRPPSALPWAYVKIAEGCDRNCGFCAIPSFRGPQNSREADSILREVEELDVREVVLVAQDLASYGKDRGERGSIVSLVDKVAAAVDRVRLLYLYPSDLTEDLIEAVLATGVPYFDLSLQHVSKPHLRRMRRWGDGDRFLERISRIRELAPDAAFRSNFIVGYPGETEDDQAQLVQWLEDAQLDWCGLFTYSKEEGTYAADLDNEVPRNLMVERHAELSEIQDGITAAHNDEMVGSRLRILVDSPGVGRSHREAPEIDGVVHVSEDLAVGEFHEVKLLWSDGPDLGATIESLSGQAQSK
ncbi:MAG: 30S ribosomal protein S12 methylthiotransferase RimO [Acidimicrobiales bacterium]|jgi:ribosomal protein S12 methylthiotransferase|nr:30S ribosomal protein S12 methylthiotransferase RimO [Acidimicrobiales bacterium]